MNVSEDKISLGCDGDFRIYEDSKRGTILIAPYALTEVRALACQSDSLEARALKAVEEHFIKKKRTGCTVGEPESVSGHMIEVRYQCGKGPASIS